MELLKDILPFISILSVFGLYVIRSAWTYEITEANKDGIGLTKEQFYAKYPDLQGWAVQ